MKKLRLNSIFVLFLALLLFTGCSKNDDTQPATANDYSGTWRVSYFFDNSDETAMFTGYTFTFNSPGVLTASKGGTTVNGTWSINSTKLIINFGVQTPLDELNDDWLIEEKTSTSIKLKEDNPAQTDKLQFTRL